MLSFAVLLSCIFHFVCFVCDIFAFANEMLNKNIADI